MSEDLQSLLEKIRQEGVEKAEAEAAQIVAKATAQAAQIVKAAKEEAAQTVKNAAQTAENYEKNAKETLKQAARDTVLEVQGAIGRKLENLLAKNVETALADPASAATFALAAVMSIGTGGDTEIAANKKIAAALKAQISAQAAKGVKILTDETIESGFSVRLDGGRVEHDFSGKAAAAALAKRLRPDLAALLE